MLYYMAFNAVTRPHTLKFTMGVQSKARAGMITGVLTIAKGKQGKLCVITSKVRNAILLGYTINGIHR